MKIAHVIDSMEVGGAETIVSQMCGLQREQGHNPCVYALASLGAIGEQMRRDGFTVEANVGPHLPDAARSFYRIFKASRPDVVHLHNATPTICAAMAARLAGVPHIVSTRHSLVEAPHKWVQELKYAVAACFCDWIVGICDATAENLKAMHTIPGRKILRVYNGAAPIERVPGDRWPPKSGFTFLYVGRFAVVKNHPLLLNAFRIALASMPDLQLWMVGDGSERAATESLAADLGIAGQVTFWGQQLDVAPFFSAADAFIMSSTTEGLPVSLLQAFSLGIPAIVTKVGGMAEVLRLSQAGILVSPTDPVEMAGAIQRMANSSVERSRFSRQAGAAFTSQFTLETMVDAYAKLYRRTPRALPKAQA